jgi:hypothetical protein
MLITYLKINNIQMFVLAESPHMAIVEVGVSPV